MCCGKGHRHLKFNVGGVVLRETHQLSSAARGFAASLRSWNGPYQITAQMSDITYGLNRLSTNEHSERVHVADLKKYFLRDQDGNERDTTEGDRERPGLFNDLLRGAPSASQPWWSAGL